MIARILALSLLLVCSCDRPVVEEPPRQSETTVAGSDDAAPEPPPAKPVIQFDGEFRNVGQRPVRDGEPEVVDVPPEIVEALNAVVEERIGSAFMVRELAPGEKVQVELGGPERSDGLMVSITRGDKTVSRHIPPATNEPELVSNMDHTVDRVLDELGVSRK